MSINTDNINHIPFCDRKWQTLSVRREETRHALLYLAEKTASVICYPLRRLSCDLEDHAYYHRLFLYHMEECHAKYKKYLIDFSVNMTPRITRRQQFDDDQLEQITKIFGQNEIAGWMHLGSNFLHVKQYKLHLNILGNCYGMSLDFLSLYLKQIALGSSPKDAVRAIASRYVNGTPDEALLAQIFMEALGWKYEYEYPFESRRPVGVNLASEREKVIFEKMDLKKIDGASFSTTNTRFELEAFLLNQLPLGAHIILIDPFNLNIGDGHAIALIKTEESYFLLEPSGAILNCPSDKASDLIIEITRDHYKEAACNLAFTQVALL